MVNGLGLRLENLRDQVGYSQKEISSKLGFSNNTYGQYEREERTPSIGTLIKLAKFYHVSLDYLLRGEEYKENENNLTKDMAIKEVLDAFKKQEIDNSYKSRSSHEIYEEHEESLTEFIIIIVNFIILI